MKWPLVEEKKDGTIRSTITEYMNRTTELIVDADNCKLCKQCVKACPREALVMPPRPPRGVKKPIYERMPMFPDSNKCVFCGICMVVCPYDAISMKLDGEILEVKDLALFKEKVIPELTEVKNGSVVMKDPEFKSEMWNKVLDKIVIKRKPKAKT